MDFIAYFALVYSLACYAIVWKGNVDYNQSGIETYGKSRTRTHAEATAAKQNELSSWASDDGSKGKSMKKVWSRVGNRTCQVYICIYMHAWVEERKKSACGSILGKHSCKQHYRFCKRKCFEVYWVKQHFKNDMKPELERKNITKENFPHPNHVWVWYYPFSYKTLKVLY